MVLVFETNRQQSNLACVSCLAPPSPMDDDDDWIHCAEARRVFRPTKQAARPSSMPAIKKIIKPVTKKITKLPELKMTKKIIKPVTKMTKKKPITKRTAEPIAKPIVIAATKPIAKPSGKTLPSAPSSSGSNNNSKSLRLGTWCSGIECLGQALRSCGVDFVHAFACDTLRTAQECAYSLPVTTTARLVLQRPTTTTTNYTVTTIPHLAFCSVLVLLRFYYCDGG